VNGRVDEWMVSVMLATSLALLVLLPIEIVSWLIASDPTAHTAEWVADRWSNAAWRAVDWVFLVVGLAHGGLGAVRWLNRDRAVGGFRSAVAVFVATASFALLILGSYTLFTFELT
jgi:succinate dehydrogenase hydrophobic anchor subunit